MVDTAHPFPRISVPMVDPETGKIQKHWIDFLRALWERTGAGLGGSITDALVTTALDQDEADLQARKEIEEVFLETLMLGSDDAVATCCGVTVEKQSGGKTLSIADSCKLFTNEA